MLAIKVLHQSVTTLVTLLHPLTRRRSRFPGGTGLNSFYSALIPVHKNHNMASDSNVRISACQMTSTENKSQNLHVVSTLIDEATTQGSKMVFFPECFDFITPDKITSANMSETLDGEFLFALKAKAKSNQVWLSLGGFHEREPTNRPDNYPWMSNAHILINDQGEIVSHYKKVHLFSASSDVLGAGRALNESHSIKAGDEILTPVSTPIGKLGLGVCYDLRFPEFSRSLRSLGADALTFPSAFTVPTGEAHWEPLLRARAIENQCYVIAPAQIGEHHPKRASYGHSMIIDPWGKVLVEADEHQSIITVDIDVNLVQEVREKMKVFSHRRPDIYVQSEGPSNVCQPQQKRFALPDPTEDEGLVPFGHIDLKRKFIFLESFYSRAFVNRKCVLPGHVLVIPKRPALRMHELTSDEVSDLFQMVQIVQKLMEQVHKSQSSTITIQDGPDAGQSVNHLHVHVIPRKSMDFSKNDEIYEKLATHDKGQVQWRTDEEMLTEAQNLRKFLQENDILPTC